ncbi:MAG TPA: hypothetical protein VN455_10070 [Methanotrichaceae archaeon]|nr:hypothetical protein [Methanotrichaceae archaeon]
MAFNGSLWKQALAIFLALSFGCFAAVAQDPGDCDGLGTIKSVKDATINKSSIAGATGNLLSTGGSFKEHGVDEPCDPVQKFGPFNVESGGKLNASITGNPPVQNVWSLYNANTGMSIYYSPRYGNGYGPEDSLLGLSGGAENSNLNGSAEWPGPGKITVIIAPPRGAGPLSGACFSQGYSASIDIVSLNKEGPARAGSILNPGDTIKTGGSGEATALLNSNGGKLWIGPNSELKLERGEEVSDDSSKLKTKSGTPEDSTARVNAKLQELFDAGLPMPRQYYLDPRGFINNFRSGTIDEATAILDSESDPCEASVQLKLFFESHQGEWTGQKTVETAWTLFGKDEWDLMEVAYMGIPIYGPLAELIASVDDWNDRWEVLSREVKDWTASNEASVGLDAFRNSKGWTPEELDSNLKSKRMEVVLTQSKISQIKENLARDLENEYNKVQLEVAKKYGNPKLYGEDAVEWVNFNDYVRTKNGKAFGEIRDLELKLSDLMIQEKTLQRYRAPIVGKKCEDLKTPKVPTFKPCSDSASLQFYEGTLRYSNSNPSSSAGPKIEIGSYTITPKGTELVCEKKAETGRVAVIEGSAIISNDTRSDIQLLSGQQLDISNGNISSFNLSTDDGGLVGGISLRDLPLNDAEGLPYGLYLPDFNGSLPQGWVWQDPGNDTEIETHQNGTLKVTVPDGNEFWDTRTQAPRLLHKATGDFELEGEILLKLNGTDLATSEFIIYSPGSYLGYLAKQMSPEGLGAHYRILGGGWAKTAGMDKLVTLNKEQKDGPNAPDIPVKLKLTRSGDIWKTYWSLDGQHWNLSTRQEINASDTVWVGWLFKRVAYDGRYSEPAITTLKDVRLATEPRDSMKFPDLDLVQWMGTAESENGTVKLALNGTTLGDAAAYTGVRHAGDLDAVVSFDTSNWTGQDGTHRDFSLLATNGDDKNYAYIGISQSGTEPPRYQTDLRINGGWIRYNWIKTSDRQGYLRIARHNGNFSTYYWSECQWVQLADFKAGFNDPIYIGVYIGNSYQATKPVALAANFSLEQIAEWEPGKNWTPDSCSLLQPVPLPSGIGLPDGVEASMFQPAFPLGNLFFGPDGTAYAFSSQIDKQKLVAIYANGTARTYAQSEVLAGINGKSGVLSEENVLMTVDYGPEGGNKFSGIFDLKADGTYRLWNSTEGYGGLASLIPAPDGGWYFSDFEKDNIYHLAREGDEAKPLISKGVIPQGLGTLAYDRDDGALYALNWAGGWPFGNNYSLYRIGDEGEAALVATINETSTLNGGMDISYGGPFGHGIYVSDTEGGKILKVESDGTVTPIITGLNKPGKIQFNPVTGDLLVVCDDGKALLWAGFGPRETDQGLSGTPSSRGQQPSQTLLGGLTPEDDTGEGPVRPLAGGTSGLDLTGDWTMSGRQDEVENSDWKATLTLMPDGTLNWIQTDGASVGATRSGTWEYDGSTLTMKWMAPKGGLITWTSGSVTGQEVSNGIYTAERVRGGTWSASRSGSSESGQMTRLQGVWAMEGRTTGAQNSDWRATLILDQDGKLDWRETEGATVGATRTGTWVFDGTTVTLRWMTPSGGQTVWTSDSVTDQKISDGTYTAGNDQEGTWSASRSGSLI